MSEAYLGLGSNEGKRAKNLESALRALEKDVLVLAVSPVYITKAWGLENQRNFYNQIAKIETSKKPHEVLDLLLHTERLLGRNRTIKWGPRCIDLDLLFYEDAILNDSDLIVPHPGIADRNFILTGMMDLAPNLRHPVLGKTIRELYLQCLDKLDVLLIET